VRWEKVKGRNLSKKMHLKIMEKTPKKRRAGVFDEKHQKALSCRK
jgi:hypothetical protein